MISILCFCVFIVCSCQNNEKGIVIDTVKFNALMTDPSNAGKRFSLIGYPSVKGDIRVGASYEGSLFLTSEPDGRGESIALLDVKLGKDKNEIYVPDKFTNADLIVYDNEGGVLTTNDKIQVSFTVDMDTKRSPITRTKTEVVGTAIQSNEVTEYFGQGAVDIRIDRVD